ncbi:MAG: thiamine pyrophosphate-binding protein [Deltaproteobacteria bacterium]|nr:thiamine pyrophosphate-binding protein [Deltaproteobacteria bacterium]
MPRGADGVVQALKEAGVDTIFGIPSIHNIGLYDVLRREPSIRHIQCRHEAAATHMADGYARAGGRLGVIVSSTGPGAGFTLSSMQEAWGSCSPVLMITTDIDAAKIGKGLGVLHELEEQGSLFRTVTKATFCVRPGDDFRATTKKAIELALSGRPGPVCIQAPTDLLAGEVTASSATAEATASSAPPLPARLDEAVALLRRAKQPLIILGTDAAREQVSADLTALAEAICAPVIVSTAAKGVVAEDHPLTFGNLARRMAVKDLVPQCDVALAIGTRLREVDGKRRGLVLPEQLIHVDWDERWIGKNFPTAVPLVGDVRAITKELRRQLEGGEPYSGARQQRVAEWRTQSDTERARLQQELIEVRYLDAIRACLPRDSTLVLDNAQLAYWAEYFYPSYQANGVIGAKGSGLLGFSFPGAIGAKVARPEKPVVGIIGDGGFLYTSQELATCVRHKIGFPMIVVNDNAYGVIGYLQRTAYQEEYEARLTNPDFVAFANAFGVRATRVRTPDELGATLEKALASGEMHLIELQTTIAAPPFGKY